MPDRRSPQMHNSLFDDNLGKVALLAAGGIGIISLMLFAPCVITERVNATDETSGVSTQEVTVPEPTLSVSLSSAVELDIVPTSTGTTSSATASLGITTTESDSYSIYLSAEGSGALVSADPDNTATIANTSTAATLAGLEANTWGYALSEDTPTSSTLYQTLPTNTDASILTVDTASTDGASDTYNLSFGTKVDGNLPADTYTTEVTVSVVAAPRAPTLSDITYMQDMTPEICATSQENETKRLIDSRDGKYYWVAKLADGNCWMTQNLALELNGITLTPEDSDVSSEWSPRDVMLDTMTQETLNSSTVRGWYFGEYVNFRPTEYKAHMHCNNSTPIYSPEECPSYYLDVSNWTAIDAIDEDGQVIYETNNTYDAHYLTGAYYTWMAITAGTGIAGATTVSASESICPRNWQLSGSLGYAGLIDSYSSAGSQVVDATDFVVAPLYYFRGGYVSSSYVDTTYNGPYWTSAASGKYVTIFQLISDEIKWPNTTLPSRGHNARCLAVSQ